MTNTESTSEPTPIEVWLRSESLGLVCTVVRPDETTKTLDVDALSMRGAEREMTGWFIGQGYAPVGRWQTEASDGDESIEVVRTFKFKH